MMRYLDDEWITAVGKALTGLEPLDEDLVAGYTVLPKGWPIGASHPSPVQTQPGTYSYSIRLGRGSVSVHRGVEEANLVFISSQRLATEIALGTRSAQRAFLDGELRVEGDVNILLGHSKKFAQIGDRLAGIRQQTVYPMASTITGD